MPPRSKRHESPSSERTRKPLPTDHAVFVSRHQIEETTVEPMQKTASEQSEVTPLDIDSHRVQYRVPLFYLGAEELIKAAPECQAEITQLTEFDIEELSDQLETALAPIYALVLRTVILTYVNRPWQTDPQR